MVVTNLITFLSYLTIACTLFYLVRRTGKILVRDLGYFLLGFALSFSPAAPPTCSK